MIGEPVAEAGGVAGATGWTAACGNKNGKITGAGCALVVVVGAVVDC